MQLVLAQVVYGIHALVVAFACIAWALPWMWSIWTALIVYPLIQLNWCIFGGRCILTLWEEKLRGDPLQRFAVEHEPRRFVAELGSRLVGRPIPVVWADRVSYSVIWGGFAVATLRFYFERSPL